MVDTRKCKGFFALPCLRSSFGFSSTCFCFFFFLAANIAYRGVLSRGKAFFFFFCLYFLRFWYGHYTKKKKCPFRTKKSFPKANSTKHTPFFLECLFVVCRCVSFFKTCRHPVLRCLYSIKFTTFFPPKVTKWKTLSNLNETKYNMLSF